MTKGKLDKLVDAAVLDIFNKQKEARRFFHKAVMHWRHTPENILAIYKQVDDATCIAGGKAFEALGYIHKAKEKPIYIYNTIVHGNGEENVYTSEFIPVQAYDIRQFEGGRKENEKRELFRKIDLDKVCSKEGVPVIEVENMPETDSGCGAYFDAETHKIVLSTGLRDDSRTAALIFAYVQAIAEKHLNEDIAMEILPENQSIVTDRAVVLTAYCIEVYCGIKPTVSNLGGILTSVAADYPTIKEQRMFLCYVCLMVQRIIKSIERNILTVEEINIINSLMTSDDADTLRAIYKRIDGQTEIDKRVQLSMHNVFGHLLEECSEDELSAIYDARIHKSLYTYPAYRIRTLADTGRKEELK